MSNWSHSGAVVLAYGETDWSATIFLINWNQIQFVVIKSHISAQLRVDVISNRNRKTHYFEVAGKKEKKQKYFVPNKKCEVHTE